MENALNIKELSQVFGISEYTMREICRQKESPAFKNGYGKTSSWLCFKEDMKKYLTEISSKFKG